MKDKLTWDTPGKVDYTTRNWGWRNRNKPDGGCVQVRVKIRKKNTTKSTSSTFHDTILKEKRRILPEFSNTQLK